MKSRGLSDIHIPELQEKGVHKGISYLKSNPWTNVKALETEGKVTTVSL